MPIEIKELHIKASISRESKGLNSFNITEKELKFIKKEVLKEVLEQLAKRRMFKEER